MDEIVNEINQLAILSGVGFAGTMLVLLLIYWGVSSKITASEKNIAWHLRCEIKRCVMRIRSEEANKRCDEAVSDLEELIESETPRSQ